MSRGEYVGDCREHRISRFASRCGGRLLSFDGGQTYRCESCGKGGDL